MEGIMYLTDSNNNKKYIQIEIEKFDKEYLEDLIDGLIAESRKDEDSIPFDEALKELEEDGILDE